MVAHDDDIDAAVQVHLLQSVHQLTDDVVNVPKWVVQLRVGGGGGGGRGRRQTHTLDRLWSGGGARAASHPPRCSEVPVDVRMRLAAPSARHRRTACGEDGTVVCVCLWWWGVSRVSFNWF